MAEKVKRTVEQKQLSNLIVAKFVHNAPSSQWGKQRAMAYKLMEKFPDKKFWVSLPSNEEVFSLAYYLTDLGLQNLKMHNIKIKQKGKKLESFEQEEPEKTDLKPLETFEVKTNKTKSRLDFMRGK